MDQRITTLLETNSYLKKYLDYPKEELKAMRAFISLELFTIIKKAEKGPTADFIKTCFSKDFNYLDYIVSFRNKIDMPKVSKNSTLDEIYNYEVCEKCNCKNCMKKSVIVLCNEIDKYNASKKWKLEYLDVLDAILKHKKTKFDKVADARMFEGVDTIDLLYVQAILESDLINIEKYDEEKKVAQFNYLDITHKKDNIFYINKFLNYYKNKKNVEKLELNVKSLKEINKEEDKNIRIYKLAGYYKYVMEVQKIDILTKLKKMVNPESIIKGIRVRARYFIYRYFDNVEQLPYSKKTKNQIKEILNYILNYRYISNTPYVPINILIYSNDKEGVEEISNILSEFMWFFGYLANDMRFYNEYMNNIILDKYLIKKLYYDGNNRKNGIMLIHDFENLAYAEKVTQDLVLNILSDEIEANNNRVCTIIYGDRRIIKEILSNHHKLSKSLINLELEIDDLDIEKINELVIKKLEDHTTLTQEVKDKIYNYIKATYKQSDSQNLEYVNKLYNLIVLNMNNKFNMDKENKLTIKDIPDAYNTKDIDSIMSELNELVGLKEIKEQINDLVALLRFNKKTNIDISNFNLHMTFEGNPGTGKTTVGRIITDIFYNLGYIKQNKLTEVTSKDLIAEYLGQTQGKTFNVVKSALGGVLFIDEAYSITAEKSEYGNECIATLLKMMEDYRDKLIIIFAGYKDEMRDFIDANPGLLSRIGYTINFPNFSIEELTQIFLNLLKKNNLTITNKALERLKKIIKESASVENFGNARYINNIFQKVLIQHAKNTEKSKEKVDLLEITEADIIYDKLIADNKQRKIGFN